MNSPLRPDVVAWMSANVIPFEAEIRRVARRHCGSDAEIDDLLQDIYYRIMTMESVAHIREPKAFLIRTAKNLIVDRFRRNSVIPIEIYANLQELEVEDPAPSPERVAMARAELKWVLGLVANLPERCGRVFSARKIFGLSQNETAESLGISENIVEKEMMKAWKMVSDMVSRVGVDMVKDESDRHASPLPSLKVKWPA